MQTKHLSVPLLPTQGQTTPPLGSPPTHFCACKAPWPPPFYCACKAPGHHPSIAPSSYLIFPPLFPYFTVHIPCDGSMRWFHVSTPWTHTSMPTHAQMAAPTRSPPIRPCPACGPGKQAAAALQGPPVRMDNHQPSQRGSTATRRIFKPTHAVK